MLHFCLDGLTSLARACTHTIVFEDRSFGALNGATDDTKPTCDEPGKRFATATSTAVRLIGLAAHRPLGDNR